MKSKSWVFLILSAIFIKWVSLYPDIIEKYYSRGVYPVISKIQRLLFGWIPFSIGDLFYGFLVLIILYKTVQLGKIIWRKKFNRQYLVAGLQQAIFFFLFVYVLFNLFWGLNYNRLGIAYQLNLKVEKYSINDLEAVCKKLHERLNYYAAQVDTTKRGQLKNKKHLFDLAAASYKPGAEKFPFLKYKSKSLKPSLYSYLGHYIGFQGYYNPFSGEGQVKTIVPVFIQPFVSCHEIAHQLGYAKENEANFAGYLACKESSSVDFRYSVYYDMYRYASIELFFRDSSFYNELRKNLHQRVKTDSRELARYYSRLKNSIQPYMYKIYENYLKMNNQPEGHQTYNNVVGWLVAYYKKYGIEEL